MRTAYKSTVAGSVADRPTSPESAIDWSVVIADYAPPSQRAELVEVAPRTPAATVPDADAVVAAGHPVILPDRAVDALVGVGATNSAETIAVSSADRSTSPASPNDGSTPTASHAPLAEPAVVAEAAPRIWVDTVPYARPVALVDSDPMTQPDRAVDASAGASATNAALFAPPVSPTLAQEVTYINGLNPDGTISNTSFWGMNGNSAHKYGASTAGTGATISYSFDAASGFTATEQATFLKAFAMWQSVANVQFTAAASAAAADVLLQRGTSGGAYESGPTYLGSGAVLGSPAGQATISIQTSVAGFDLSGSFDVVGGYGLSTTIHEVGHLLGLGHGGGYNGAVTPSTQQFSAYDERLYTTMSYIYYASSNPLYAASYPVTGTNWGVSPDGYRRQAPHTVQMLDILAIQQLYGGPTSGPLTGGQVFGFNTNLSGALKDFFDFTVNTHPVVTLYDQGTGNTLDLSGYSAAQAINLNGGTFSSVAGLSNNLAIATGAQINTLVGGSGNDTIVANINGDTINGGAGTDTVSFAVATTGVTASLATGLASGGAGTVTLIGVEGLIGTTAADSLTGDAGANTLDGGGGADTLTGGAGNDTYTVNNSGVTVVESPGGGTDTVITSVSGYVLPANVERLVYTGSAAQTFTGSAGVDDITGGSGNDSFDFSQGGNDVAAGAGGTDLFFFGAALTAADRVDGGDGNDQVGLQGNYTGANKLVLSATTLINVETIAALPGFSYDITSNDANVAAGQTMTIYGSTLASGNNLTFDGSAETDGKFVVYGGLGIDTITTGAGTDAIYFGRGGRFGAGDHVDGGAGTDQLALDGSYTVTISGTQVVNVEVLALIDTSADPAVYNVTLADDWSHPGDSRTVNFNTLRVGATVDGSAELDTRMIFYGGNGDDVIRGGQAGNTIHGGLGADTIYGGAGADIFSYTRIPQSIGTSHDTIVGFNANADTIDLPFTVQSVDANASGNLGSGTLDDGLAAMLSGLQAYHAVQVTAVGGAFGGHVFEVIDANGVAGYQAGVDMVIELQSTINPITAPASFV